MSWTTYVLLNGAFRGELPGGSAAVGEYLLVDPPGLLVYTWGWENDELVPPGLARFLGRRLAYTYEVREFVEGECLVMSASEGGFPMETTYTWEDTETGATRMTLRNRGNPAGFSKIAAPIMEAAMRRANRKDLERLRASSNGTESQLSVRTQIRATARDERRALGQARSVHSSITSTTRTSFHAPCVRYK